MKRATVGGRFLGRLGILEAAGNGGCAGDRGSVEAMNGVLKGSRVE